MKIYNESEDWKWRFGETPNFKNSIEHKFDWALVDFEFDVEGGVIVKGRCYSDCLVPQYIEAINLIFETEKITYDVQGIKNMCNLLRLKF